MKCLGRNFTSSCTTRLVPLSLYLRCTRNHKRSTERYLAHSTHTQYEHEFLDAKGNIQTTLVLSSRTVAGMYARVANNTSPTPYQAWTQSKVLQGDVAAAAEYIWTRSAFLFFFPLLMFTFIFTTVQSFWRLTRLAIEEIIWGRVFS